MTGVWMKLEKILRIGPNVLHGHTTFHKKFGIYSIFVVSCLELNKQLFENKFVVLSLY